MRLRLVVAFLYGAGKLLRSLQAFEMFWHAEGMKTAYTGEVLWNGGNGRGTVKLYRKSKLVDEIIADDEQLLFARPSAFPIRDLAVNSVL